MTTTVKVNVGGNYRATVNVKHADGHEETQSVGPDAESYIYLHHPAAATIEISEEYLGDQPTTAEPPAAEASAE